MYSEDIRAIAWRVYHKKDIEATLKAVPATVFASRERVVFGDNRRSIGQRVTKRS